MRIFLYLISGTMSRAISKRAKETDRPFRDHARIALIIGMCQIAAYQDAKNLKDYVKKEETT